MLTVLSADKYKIESDLFLKHPASCYFTHFLLLSLDCVLSYKTFLFDVNVDSPNFI